MKSSQLIANTIINRLRSLRLERQQLAEMTSTHPSTVTKWLSGNHNFTVDTLDNISEVLKISFFNIKEDKIVSCFPCVVKSNLFSIKEKENELH